MKKLLLTLLLMLTALIGYSQHQSYPLYVQFKANYMLNGKWHRWLYYNYITRDTKIGFYYDGNDVMNGMYFVLAGVTHLEFNFPYVKYPRTTLREHRKSNEYYTYSGTVEYYVWEDSPTIEHVLSWAYFPAVPPPGQKSVKRKAHATIKIAPYRYRNGPHEFYLYFDNVGLAIQFEDWPFDEKYIR